ncbi:hypothetical protein [Luteimicrobium sp. DT211]|uniref:hypothetical protein n=1 Tax=Luteimicrobium sp. DT211 TaxID=3393412 RepID=UPI003CEC4BE9
MSSPGRTLTVWCFLDATGAELALETVTKNLRGADKLLREHVSIVWHVDVPAPGWQYAQDRVGRRDDDARSGPRRFLRAATAMLGRGIEYPGTRTLSDAFIFAGIGEDVEEAVSRELHVDSSALLLLTDGPGPDVEIVAHARPTLTLTRSGAALRKVSLLEGFADLDGVDRYRGT